MVSSQVYNLGLYVLLAITHYDKMLLSSLIA